jgi:purine-binding chemotaxis protein CheW
MADETLEQAERDHYLLFCLGDELYGAELLSVREVLEPQKPKAIPQTVRSFLGVVNIRGEIVGVLDLRIRLGYPSEGSNRTAMMVIAGTGAPIAALVDRMDGVAKIPDERIDRNARVENRMPIKYIVGIAQHKGQLVTIVDLNAVLEHEEFSAISQGLARVANI